MRHELSPPLSTSALARYPVVNECNHGSLEKLGDARKHGFQIFWLLVVQHVRDFGDPVAGGKPSPQVTLDCTLKLIKEDKRRRLFEVRGPKIDTRLSLVVERDIAPWGDGRLLVHGKDGEVRYVVDVWQPRAKPQPGPKP
jgi:hypothetical protein